MLGAFGDLFDDGEDYDDSVVVQSSTGIVILCFEFLKFNFDINSSSSLLDLIGLETNVRRIINETCDM